MPLAPEACRDAFCLRQISPGDGLRPPCPSVSHVMLRLSSLAAAELGVSVAPLGGGTLSSAPGALLAADLPPASRSLIPCIWLERAPMKPEARSLKAVLSVAGGRAWSRAGPDEPAAADGGGVDAAGEAAGAGADPDVCPVAPSEPPGGAGGGAGAGGSTGGGGGADDDAAASRGRLGPTPGTLRSCAPPVSFLSMSRSPSATSRGTSWIGPKPRFWKANHVATA